MATALRVTARLTSRLVGRSRAVTASGPPRATAAPATPLPVVSIVSPATRGITSIASYAGDLPDRPKPFNYRIDNYVKDRSRLPYAQTAYSEYTSWRFDENTRVIAVEGSVASGKHEFARELAKQLGFFYAPQCPVEHLWYNEHYKFHEYDMDQVLEPDQRIYTPAAWHADPHSKPDAEGFQGRVGGLQMDYLIVRLHTYSDALLHMLSTGQGVVTVRTPWSDMAFAQALQQSGYFTEPGFAHYKRMYRNLVHDNPRPHVTVYLENPVSSVLDNIKKRGREGEATSGKIDQKFLESVEAGYQDSVLPHMKEHGECLVYPSLTKPTPHDVSLVVEDIERLGSLEAAMAYDDDYLADWLELFAEPAVADMRTQMDSEDYRKKNIEGFDFPHDVPGMVMSVEDFNERRAVLKEWPGFRYADGYDPDLDGFASSMFGPEPKEVRKFFIPPSDLFKPEDKPKSLIYRML